MRFQNVSFFEKNYLDSTNHKMEDQREKTKFLIFFPIQNRVANQSKLL